MILYRHDSGLILQALIGSPSRFHPETWLLLTTNERIVRVSEEHIYLPMDYTDVSDRAVVTSMKAGIKSRLNYWRMHAQHN